MLCATSRLLALCVSCSTASRTSVFSLNMMVAPARTNKSAAKPTTGLAVTPENASLPPHCTPTTNSLAGTVSRRLAFRRAKCGLAPSTMCCNMDMKPTCWSSCKQMVSGPSVAVRSSTNGKLPGGNKRCGGNFSQPRLITNTSLPKLGLRLMLRRVRMGMTASGASMATPQP